MRRYFPLLILVPLILLSACAPGANELVGTVAETASSPAGFWLGLWHGMICGFTFFISLFTESVSVYEVHNSGGWYDFGFVLGAGILLGGGASASSRD